jgi:transposase
MGKPYSQDLRERVMAAVDSGLGAYAAAPLFRVSVSYIYKVLGRRRATGETTARRGRAGRKPKLAAHDDALRERVGEHADATLEELQAWLAAERKVRVSIGCLWNRLRLLGLPLKKSHNGRPSRIGRMSRMPARNGGRTRLSSILNASSSSMKRVRRPT